MNSTAKAIRTTSVFARTAMAVFLFVFASSFVSFADEAVDAVAANETTGAKEIIEKWRKKKNSGMTILSELKEDTD